MTTEKRRFNARELVLIEHRENLHRRLKDNMRQIKALKADRAKIRRAIDSTTNEIVESILKRT